MKEMRGNGAARLRREKKSCVDMATALELRGRGEDVGSGQWQQGLGSDEKIELQH